MSRFDRPGPDSDVDAWWIDHGRFLRTEPRQPIPSGERACTACGELVPVSGDQLLEVGFKCAHCFQQMCNRIAAQRERVAVKR